MEYVKYYTIIQLEHACNIGDIIGVGKMIEYFGDVNIRLNDIGDTCLIIAARKQNYNLIKYLISIKGCKIDILNKCFDSAIFYAIFYNNREIIKLLECNLYKNLTCRCACSCEKFAEANHICIEP